MPVPAKRKQQRVDAKAALYEELEGAVKDGGCQIVAVTGGVSTERGCCALWKRSSPDANAFRCGTCKYER